MKLIPKFNLILDKSDTSRSGKETKTHTVIESKPLDWTFEGDEPTAADLKALCSAKIDSSIYVKVSEEVKEKNKENSLADDAPIKDIKFVVYTAHVTRVVVETPAPAPAPEV